MTDSINKKILVNYSVTGIIIVSITGTLAHFIYDWTGQNRIIGLFTAVNESTWEHMKLLFFPMLLFSIFTWIKLRKRVPAAQSAMLIATLVGTALIPVLFYTYTGILGVMITVANLAIYYVSVITSFIIFYLIASRYKLEEVSIIMYLIITVFICMFFLFTYDPPNLGIFIDPTAENNVMSHIHPAAW